LHIWQIFGRPDIGLLGYTLNHLGINYNYVSTSSTLATVIVMSLDWTSCGLLCYAGLKSIPDAYYQAARSTAPRVGGLHAIQLRR